MNSAGQFNGKFSHSLARKRAPTYYGGTHGAASQLTQVGADLSANLLCSAAADFYTHSPASGLLHMIAVRMVNEMSLFEE